MQSAESLVAKVADGIWIGNAAVPAVHFKINDISAVVKLDSGVIIDPDIDCFTYALPDTELLTEEIPRAITKLNVICTIISEMRGVGRNVIIQCADGKNKSALVAAFYLTRYLGQPRDVVVKQLSAVYYSPAQVAEDAAECLRNEKLLRGEDVPPMSQEELKQQGARRARQALANLSFRRIVMMA